MIEQPRRPVLDRRLEVFAYELGLHTKAEIDTLAGGKFCFVTITADLLARGLSDTELPIGVVTELVGLPAFLLVLRNVRKGWTS